MRAWPRSLAGRTATTLVAVLVAVQLAGLSIYSLDRAELQRLADERDLGTRVGALYRAMMAQPAEAWAGVVQDMPAPPGEHHAIEPSFPPDAPEPANSADQRLIRAYFAFPTSPVPLRPRAVLLRGTYAPGTVLLIGAQLPDDR